MIKIFTKLPFYNQDWFQFIIFLVRHFIQDKCQQKAASLTYTSLLSIVPFLTVVLVILSTIPALESVREQIYGLIYENLMPSSTSQVSEYINSFTEKSANLTTMGILVLFLTSVMMLRTIAGAFNQIWRVQDNDKIIKRVLRYLVMLTLIPIIMGIAFLASTAVGAFSLYTQEIVDNAIDLSFWLQLLPYCLTAAGFISMYWFVPKVNVPIKNATIAGIIITLLFEGIKSVFGTLIANFTSYEAVYGAFAALPVFLMWIYLSWNLILLGVEISYTLTIFDTKTSKTNHPFVSTLAMLAVLYSKQKQGEEVNEQTLKDAIGRRELPNWYQYIEDLKTVGLIGITKNKKYVLKKNLENMNLWQLYNAMPYPLPIKEELEKMYQNLPDDNKWQKDLIYKLAETKQHLQQDLNQPLSNLFDNRNN